MSQKLCRLFILVGFGLVLFSAKLGLIAWGGHALPTWDQWDSECEITLRPWLEARLELSNILLPHCEHRIVTTKLTALGLLMLNGQWDNLLETTFNAGIHSLCGVLFLVIARRWISGVWLGALAVLLALLFALPFAWQNTLVGFQVQFYYLLLFSLLYIYLTLSTDRFSWRWVGGACAGVLAIWSLASGLLAPAAVAAVLAFRALVIKKITLHQCVTILVALALCLSGWWLKTEVAAHDFLKVETAAKFWSNLLLLFSWPASFLFPWSALVATPIFIFAYRFVRARTPDRADVVLSAFCVWQLLQLSGVAYTRGGAGSVLTSRYLDMVLVGVVLGWICLSREIKGHRRQVVAVAWVIIVGAGLVEQSLLQWRTEVVPDRARRDHQEENVRGYLRTGDANFINNKPFAEIPYPDPAALINRLSHPSIRAVMPWTVRPTVPIADITPGALPATVEPLPAPLALSTWSPGFADHPVIWRSSIQSASTLPVLRFRIVGNTELGGNHARLFVKTATSEVEVTSKGLSNRWKTANVVRPSGDWWIEVTGGAPNEWFAFTEPVELGLGSYFVGKLVKHYLFLSLLGLGLIAFGVRNEIRRPFFVPELIDQGVEDRTPVS